MKFSKFNILLLFAVLFLNMQCDDDDGVQPIANCDETTVVDNTLYQNAQSAHYSFGNVELHGDCLSIIISTSGCGADTWELELIGSEDVMESFPVQRNIKAALTNNEACLAVFSREWTFNLAPLQVDGENQVMLNLQNFSEPILYSY
ncbi:hypothetical protein [Winogradskyella sp.]|uniref:hypothetical protein n=1 Tax=Winogradskyella sp. TaxID=1883156 RepID=UPI0035132D68